MLTIIGGSGFIGTRLSDQLTKENIEFKIVDIAKSDKYPENGSLAMSLSQNLY